MRFMILLFALITLNGSFALANSGKGKLLGSTATLPESILKEMVDAGVGEWIQLEAKAGNSISVGQPLLCESCGAGYIPKIGNVDKPKCTNCGYPADENTKRFVTPKRVLPNKNLEIFVLKNTDPKLNPELTRRVALLMGVDLIPCTSCGNNLNPALANSCYGCGTEIDKSKVKKSTPVVEKITADEHMPKPGSTVTTERPKTLKGTVSSNTGAVDTRSSLPPKRQTPRIPTKVVAGVGVGAAAMVVAYGIGYMMTTNDVHHSLGRVEVISSEEVRIIVPGFPQPIILTYDPEVKNNDGLYSKTTLEPYLDVELVDVWWTNSEGVIQILPLDVSSEINALIEGTTK